jgi:hypothetical protein
MRSSRRHVFMQCYTLERNAGDCQYLQALEQYILATGSKISEIKGRNSRTLHVPSLMSALKSLDRGSQEQSSWLEAIEASY